MSESLAGTTFLAFGNGSPDVFSTFAAMKTHSGSLAVGELIGAASFITAVVAGSMALVRPFKVARKSFVRDIGFFIVAASFSMSFLADGHLSLWECAVMVGFYVFYVAFVVGWHWYLRRRAAHRAIEETARSHFTVPGTDEDTMEQYNDEDDEDLQRARSRATTRTISFEDFANLERGGSPAPKAIAEEIDANDETRDRYLAEISKNMRVSRPRAGERRNTVNPIRPSLVGALEFNAVLSSLQRSRNIQAMPLNSRRYSDDPNYTAAQQQDGRAPSSFPEASREDEAREIPGAAGRSSQDGDRRSTRRTRAVSTNDLIDLRVEDDDAQEHDRDIPRIDLVASSPSRSDGSPIADDSQWAERPSQGPPKLSLQPPSDSQGDIVASPDAMTPRHRRNSELLGLPSHKTTSSAGEERIASPQVSPLTRKRPYSPKLDIPRSPDFTLPRSSPTTPFPPFFDDPNFVPSASYFQLPPPGLDPGQQLTREDSDRPLRWWPYRVLPSPQVLLSTLLPTLYNWSNKNIWERMLGIVAAPSVFLFVITLPTVETEKEEDDLPEIVDPDPGLLSPEDQHRPAHARLAPESPSVNYDQSNGGKPTNQSNYGTVSPAINVIAPDTDSARQSQPSQAPPSSPKAWNRWLLATQLFTAPFLIVLLIWANTSPGNPRALIFPILYSLLSSLLACGLLILLTSPDNPPRYRHLICYLGFVVAIAWISTIANEVVGVLKALGTILDISDAILGLTIFAVGNSCGDLVANITIARLGYPVMALSACFGAPMLNILLGIGFGGCYMTIRGAERREKEHPGTPMRFKPYQIEVGGTLLISGVTLLVTLVGLLVAVPLRGWWMDKKVGWGLVALWTISTLGAVIVEAVQWGSAT